MACDRISVMLAGGFVYLGVLHLFDCDDAAHTLERSTYFCILTMKATLNSWT